MENATNPEAVNQFTLTASLMSKSTLRYTPAGVPVSEMELSHESVQLEAGKPRKVVCNLEAIALGPLALEVEKMHLGTVSVWSGFVALRSHKQKKLQFHVCSVKSH